MKICEVRLLYSERPYYSSIREEYSGDEWDHEAVIHSDTTTVTATDTQAHTKSLYEWGLYQSVLPALPSMGCTHARSHADMLADLGPLMMIGATLIPNPWHIYMTKVS